MTDIELAENQVWQPVRGSPRLILSILPNGVSWVRSDGSVSLAMTRTFRRWIRTSGAVLLEEISQ